MVAETCWLGGNAYDEELEWSGSGSGQLNLMVSGGSVRPSAILTRPNNGLHSADKIGLPCIKQSNTSPILWNDSELFMVQNK